MRFATRRTREVLCFCLLSLPLRGNPACAPQPEFARPCVFDLERGGGLLLKHSNTPPSLVNSSTPFYPALEWPHSPHPSQSLRAPAFLTFENKKV
eukprot:g27820.t1